jgi:hypothetical protein
MPYFDCFYLNMKIRFTMSTSLFVITPAQKKEALYLESFFFVFLLQIKPHPLFHGAFAYSVSSHSAANTAGCPTVCPFSTITRATQTVRDK